jgi:hypothetical protein
MKDTVDKCLAFCQAMAKTSQKFSFSFTIGKDTYNFSTFDQRREVPARQGGDLKKAASGQLNRRQKRAADPVVRQKAAAHAAAAEEDVTAAEQATAAAADKATAATNGEAEAAEEAIKLPSPERVRASSTATRDMSLVLTPEKADTRDEPCTTGEEGNNSPGCMFVLKESMVHDPDIQIANQDELDRLGEIIEKTGNCHFCDFHCPNPLRGPNNIWNHIEEHHTSAFDWFA